MVPRPSLLERAEQSLREAEQQFDDDPTEPNERRVRQARSVLTSERNRAGQTVEPPKPN